MLPLSTAVGLLRDNPELVVVVAIGVRLLRAWQSQLSWTEYRMLHRLKRGVLPLLDRAPTVGSAVLWISDKGGRDDAEYIATVDGSVRDVVKELQRAGASLHLINSLKRRPGVHGDPLSAAHVVWFVNDTGDQVEGYTFRNHDGTIDIYCHTEAAVGDPLAHLTDGQVDGDDYNVLPVGRLDKVAVTTE